MSRFQEYWGLSWTHSTAAGDRVTCRMLQSGLFMQTTRSHTCSCVNLRCSDILHQHEGQSHFHHILSALQHVRSVDHLPCHRSTIPQWASCGEAPACCHLQQPLPELHASRATFGITVTRFTSATVCHSLTWVLHSPSSWCCMLHETKAPGLDSHLPEAPSQLPSFTLSGILPTTQEGPQTFPPRDSQRCPQLIIAPCPSPLRKHWLLSTKGRGWGTVVKVLGWRGINLFMLPYQI